MENAGVTNNTLLTGIDKIYEILFLELEEQFGMSSATPIFKTVERAFFYRDPRDSLKPHMFPWACLEWGGMSRVQPIRMAQVFEYYITFPMIVMTFADKAKQQDMVFNPAYGDNTVSGNTNPGIGDICKTICGHFWGKFKISRFNEELKRIDLDFDDNGNRITDNFGIQDWTIDGITEPDNLSVRSYFEHPWFRGQQINFRFQIWERNIKR